MSEVDFGGGWGYRVVQRDYPTGETSFSVHEVYYRTDGSLEAWIEAEAAPHGETADELGYDMVLISEALQKPTLLYDEMPGMRT